MKANITHQQHSKIYQHEMLHLRYHSRRGNTAMCLCCQIISICLRWKLLAKNFPFANILPLPSTLLHSVGGTFFKSSHGRQPLSNFPFVNISNNHRRIWKGSFSVWSLLIHFMQKLVSYSMQSLWQLSQYSEWFSLSNALQCSVILCNTLYSTAQSMGEGEWLTWNWQNHPEFHWISTTEALKS